METNLSVTEIRLLQGLVVKSSHQDIAAILGKPIEVIGPAVEKIAKANKLVSFQIKQDSKAKKQVAAIARKQEKVVKARKLKTNEAKIISRVIEQQQEQQRRKRNEPKYAIRQVDYSQMIAVRVDAKTTIYAKPGDDIEALKRKCLERMGKNREAAFAPMPRANIPKDNTAGHFEKKANKSTWLD